MLAFAFEPESSLDFLICEVGSILRLKQMEKINKSKGTLVEVMSRKKAVLGIIIL